MPFLANFQIQCFHPKTWSMLSTVWRLHKLGFKAVSLERFKILRPLASITLDFILQCRYVNRLEIVQIFIHFCCIYLSIFSLFNKSFTLPIHSSVPFCYIILISISLQHWSTSSDLVFKSDMTEKLGHSKKVSGAKNESSRLSYVP